MTENKRYVVRSMFGKIFIEDDIKRVGVLIGYEEDGKKDNIVKVTNVLNQLNDENEQLKQQKDKWKQQCIHFKEMLDDMGIAYLCDEWIYEELKGDVE